MNSALTSAYPGSPGWRVANASACLAASASAFSLSSFAFNAAASLIAFYAAASAASLSC